MKHTHVSRQPGSAGEGKSNNCTSLERFDHFRRGEQAKKEGNENPQDGPKKTRMQRVESEVAQIVECLMRFAMFDRRREADELIWAEL